MYYRCRFPTEYGLANKVEHPRNVYLAERELLNPLDQWLSRCLAPHRLDETVIALHDAQPDLDTDPAVLASARVIEECDQKLARHRAALEAGADPVLVARWMADTQARRAEAAARSQTANGKKRRMTLEEIQMLVTALGDIRDVLEKADPADKAEVYRQLGLRLTYQPGTRIVRAETDLDPHNWGYGTCPCGGT